MLDVRDDESRFEFSPRLEGVRGAMLKRLKPNRIREDTFTGAEPDGRTPFLDVFESLPGEPYEVCLASAIVRSWNETEIKIYDGEYIVGVVRPRRPLCEHFSWGIKYYSEVMEAPAYRSRRTELEARIGKQKARLFPLGIEHMDRRGAELFGEKEYASMGAGFGWFGGYQGHTVPSYPKLLTLGIDGALAQIGHYSALYSGDAKKQTLYRALKIFLKGFSDWILRYADAAEDKAAKTGDGAYLTVAGNCRRIAHDSPQTLGEAVQLVWFYAMWDWVDCLGRADQYLYPFYQRTAAAEGQDTADSYIASLMFKLLENGSHNVTLGGVKPEDGSSAANELTYLMLQIARVQHETHPRLSVRVCRDAPEELLRLVVRMWSEGMSDPTVVSDENVIPGLAGYGVKPEDARDYTMLGCQEIEIPGKSNFGCEDGMINLAKVFEYTINDGRDRFTGYQIGLHTGHLGDYSSVDALWDAYDRQVRFFTERFVELCNLGVEIRIANCAKLVKTAFTEACVERGLNLDDGGAIYNYGVVETCGSAAAADSFTAIQKLVFEDKKFDMKTLEAAVSADYKGHEEVRQLCLGAPKFGNDDPEADAWHVRVLDSFWSEIGKYRSRRGGAFTGACSLLTAGTYRGQNTWALPDGCHTGETLGNTIGPRTGADKSGLTAMLNSVMKLPLGKGVGGTTVNVLIPRSFMKTVDLRADIAALIYAYLMNGGQMAQITTADAGELRDAKLHPEAHENLIVRVGGFSIRFVELAGADQDEIIRRYGI